MVTCRTRRDEESSKKLTYRQYNKNAWSLETRPPASHSARLKQVGKIVKMKKVPRVCCRRMLIKRDSFALLIPGPKAINGFPTHKQCMSQQPGHTARDKITFFLRQNGIFVNRVLIDLLHCPLTLRINKCLWAIKTVSRLKMLRKGLYFTRRWIDLI